MKARPDCNRCLGSGEIQHRGFTTPCDACLQAERDAAIAERDAERQARERAEAERDAVIAASRGEDWGDKPIPEDNAIAAAFPTRTGRHDLYQKANRLVGAKRGKFELVALVNWLLAEREKADREAVDAHVRAAADQDEHSAQRAALVEERDTVIARADYEHERACGWVEQWNKLADTTDRVERERDAALRMLATGPWLTVIVREQTPEVLVWDTEAEARVYFDAASAQWSDSFLSRVVVGPGPRDDAQRARTHAATMGVLRRLALAERVVEAARTFHVVAPAIRHRFVDSTDDRVVSVGVWCKLSIDGLEDFYAVIKYTLSDFHAVTEAIETFDAANVGKDPGR